LGLFSNAVVAGALVMRIPKIQPTFQKKVFPKFKKTVKPRPFMPIEKIVIKPPVPPQPFVSWSPTGLCSSANLLKARIDAAAKVVESTLSMAEACIDMKTYPGATRLGKFVSSAVEKLICLPMDMQVVANVSWANLTRSSFIAAIPKTADGQCFKLYRGITRGEFDRLLAQPSGRLFALSVRKPPVGFGDVLRHVLGVHETEAGRIFTSFSASKHLAYKFASTRCQVGVLAEFEVPVDLVSRFARRGLTIHQEMLLPTELLDLSMISSVEIREHKELREAKKRELWAALHMSADLFVDSHHFETVPLRVCDPKNERDRQAFAAYLRSSGLLKRVNKK
jgi:hypothetical protein